MFLILILSLSSLSCRVSSFCRLDPSELGLSFVRVCFRRCHCAPYQNEDRGPWHDAEVGLGPGSLNAEGHAGTDAARPVLKRPANT